jgi:hypothetical protein
VSLHFTEGPCQNPLPCDNEKTTPFPYRDRCDCLKGRELDLEVVCRRGVKNDLSEFFDDVPQFKKNPVNPTLTNRGRACI